MSGLCESGLKKTLDSAIGVPNIGIHSYRIFNIAYIDVIVVLLGSILLAWGMKWNYLKTIIGMFILGIIVHQLFCVRTTLDKLLFLNYN